ncbi:uncharacterized protein EAF01_003272 [Botrytis porri]|uniref:uncharacterized protein n=1 Tax=Botrytis porri TaxID=87229 RepID=UPI001900A1F5|nr:uncharacterized protein EAF01_003272 [Botrytis porri]KAF7909554.1 hypothetical protein EAF01_003272 [Botrytis porri]
MAAAVVTQPHNLLLLVTAETCRGSTYTVTGANTSLGLEAARHLVRLGSATVIMAVRDPAFGLRALADIESPTGISGVAKDLMKIKDEPIVESNAEDMTQKAYPLSKFLKIMAIRHLTGLLPLQRTGVVINLMCPGLSKQKKRYGRTAEDGSRTLLYGAAAGEDSHGCLLKPCTIAEM